MSLRPLSPVLFALLFLLPTAARAQDAAAPAAPAKPNFLLVIADDMTYTDVGAFGNAEVRTPNLDALAAGGMKLDGMFTTAPMCAPTRMALYTALYPVRNGGHPNHSRVYDGVKSMPHYLRPLGYRVGLIGKRHYAPADNFPFDYIQGGRDDDGGNGKDLDLDAMRAWLGADDAPFCLVVASNQPHTPWNRGDPSTYDAQALTLPPYLADTPKTRDGLARYYAEITYFDDQVGRALNILDDAGHADDTVVLFDAGHADDTVVLFLSEQGSGFPHCKWTLYDTGIRAAAIARVPGVTTAGSESAALMSYVDVLPTFLDLAGGDPSALDLDGRSFAPVLRGEADTFRDTVFAVQTSRGIYSGPEHYGIRAARDAQYKYIRNLTPDATFQNTVTEKWPIFQTWRRAAEKGDADTATKIDAYQHRPAEELYDVQADPYELHNLIDDPALADVHARLSARLDAWMKQQGDQGEATEMDALNRQHRESADDE